MIRDEFSVSTDAGAAIVTVALASPAFSAATESAAESGRHCRTLGERSPNPDKPATRPYRPRNVSVPCRWGRRTQEEQAHDNDPYDRFLIHLLFLLMIQRRLYEGTRTTATDAVRCSCIRDGTGCRRTTDAGDLDHLDQSVSGLTPTAYMPAASELREVVVELVTVAVALRNIQLAVGCSPFDPLRNARG